MKSSLSNKIQTSLPEKEKNWKWKDYRNQEPKKSRELYHPSFPPSKT
jgi:hypothetical protein